MQAKKLNTILCAAISLSTAFLAASCGSPREGKHEPLFWFVHATDPHVYLWLKPDPDPKQFAKSQAVWKFQQDYDQDTFRDFLQALVTLPQPSGKPAFLLITGDFGVDPCLNLRAANPPSSPKAGQDCLSTVDSSERGVRVTKMAELLATSPIPEIYFVAGNNDLPLESADEAAMDYFNQFFDDLAKELVAKSSHVRLHNLTKCYGSAASSLLDCAQDIQGSPYRIIGFPSQSFKNKDTDYKSNQAAQARQFKKFQDLFNQASIAGKKILIATHIPEMDDPYFIAQKRYQGIDPAPSADTDKDNPRSQFAAWNIQKSLLDDWTKILASDSLVAVIAGHLHDGHKEIYQRPYSWSTVQDRQMGYRKLFLAPPLSVKNQDGSPIQARGFTTVSVFPDQVKSRIYWYDGFPPKFTAQPLPENNAPRQRSSGSLFGALLWLWNLDQSDQPLERAAVLLVALLAAFLTVIAVWQIPPSDSPFAKKPDDDKDASKDSKDSSPFTNKFGATVIAGLGGLVFTDIAKTLCGKQLSDDAKCFYIVWFILLFFLLLIVWSAFRGLAEAVRSRIAVIHYPLARQPLPPRTGSGTAGGPGAGMGHRKEKPTPFLDWFFYWFMRFAHWFYSLRVPALTFFDTFISLIQGKNQTTTRAFSDAVIDQQKVVIHAADAMRHHLSRLLESKMEPAKALASPRVRVSISVLSADQNSVFYISRAPGSSIIPFPKRSVAWVSVFTGQIRWYDIDYDDQNAASKIALFDNSRGTIADAEPQLLLASYYQQRDQDYKAFVVLPVPWPQRGFGSKYVKGAIHISFREDEDFWKLWLQKTVAPVPANIPNSNYRMYPAESHRMIEDWCVPLDVRGALQASVTALGELLYGFNEIIYKSYIEPDQT